MPTTEQEKNALENVFIIQPILSDNYRELHREAIALIESAGGAYAGTTYQIIREINPATFIGSGKLAELNLQLQGLDNITIFFNGDLSPSQTLNISAALDDRKVIDRTTLILDIFARHAQSGEGKLQVELAQLKYIYPRLKGSGIGLSRLGGGIGTRGPGETKLESDRRLIRQRIALLSGKMDELKQRRELQRERRKKNGVKTIALIGYTNTGKSTLMNLFTNADVYVQNQLFATLDATARTFSIEDIEYVLIDTVGFLQDLPHHLIDAFRSTLETAIECDLALIVCDASGDYEMQMNTTLETLSSLGFSSPYLLVMNKCDLSGIDENCLPPESICISAKTGYGIEALKKKINDNFAADFLYADLLIPYADFSNYSKVKKFITERTVRFTDGGQIISAVVPKEYYKFFKQYIQAKE